MEVERVRTTCPHCATGCQIDPRDLVAAAHLYATARVSDKTSVGETWMPFHFQDGNANWLTIASFDAICACPEYKVCAIRLEKTV